MRGGIVDIRSFNRFLFCIDNIHANVVGLQQSTFSGSNDGVAGYYDDDAEEYKKSQMRSILGAGKAHYTPLIEQLIFMEETHN